MRTRLFWWCSILTLCSLLGAPARVSASPSGEKSSGRSSARSSEAQARKAFDQGSRAYDKGNFAEALTHFERAYSLGGDDKVLFNVARAADGANRKTRAVAAYRKYLEAYPDAPQRTLIMRRLEKLSPSTAGKASEPPTTSDQESDVPPQERASSTDGEGAGEPEVEAVGDEKGKALVADVRTVRHEPSAPRDLLREREVLRSEARERSSLVLPGTLLAVGALAGVGIPLLAAGFGREPQDLALLGTGATLTAVGLLAGATGAVMLPLERARRRHIEAKLQRIDGELAGRGLRASVAPVVPARAGQPLGLLANLTF